MRAGLDNQVTNWAGLDNQVANGAGLDNQVANGAGLDNQIANGAGLRVGREFLTFHGYHQPAGFGGQKILRSEII